MAETDIPPPEPDATLAAGLRDALSRATSAGVLAAQSPPEALLDGLVRAAARAIPSPEGALFLVDPGRRVLTFEVVIGRTAATVKDLVVPLGRGIAGLVAVSGQPLAVANAQQDPRHARDIAEQSGYLPQTILAVPVTGTDGNVVGVLELLDRQERPAFGLDDMELLARFAELAALALEQRRAETARALLLGRALAALGVLPTGARAALGGRLDAYAAQIAADPAAERALELAELVAAVAGRGEAEQRACLGVLRALAGYVEERPAPGFGLDMLR